MEVAAGAFPARWPAGFRRRRHRVGIFYYYFFSKFLYQKLRFLLLYTNPALVLARKVRFGLDLHFSLKIFSHFF
ncbi:hypothetical protein MtrunA17_Chr4g0032971 [Medicago truncatula]|uniref:Uncharacterized protein n=1 Tax=Medicago truncatula TaxID=3880 RepID=A0A396I8G7_MEDTR|nr:hypothetical protein MtrunA17_Chr4g0032971 [Medicago truncatula]